MKVWHGDRLRRTHLWVFRGSQEHTDTPYKSSKTEVENTGINMSSYHVEPHGVSRLHAQSDVCKGSTDTPKMATQQTTVTIELGNAGSAKPTPMATDEDGIE